jgi:putative ATP-binding cassette transporter
MAKHPAGKPDTSESSIVRVVAETGDDVEPPPPEMLEPDPDMSPEDAEQTRKDYLLTRF